MLVARATGLSSELDNFNAEPDAPPVHPTTSEGSTVMADLADAVERLARPLAEDGDLDVLDVVVKGTGPRQRVQVIVDRKGGVTLDACRQLAKALSKQLDTDDPTDDRYTLEVTSPGIDWPLSDQASFDRVEGRTVHVRLGQDGRQTGEVRGTVGPAGSDAVQITDSAGEAHTVAYDHILSAKQEVRW
ncbi:ribosome maturation factor RimP [Euzebya tangerina]|uniref:ribosome maturation factor RimP n=1 Tax=Euzebya tangerina TaxID=591198 RepID=UPI000E3153D1|nr:hypothetical protein [Euzebya tangerina]